MADTQMEDLIKLARNQYHKEWRESHKESVKQSQNKFWLKKAKEMEENKNG